MKSRSLNHLVAALVMTCALLGAADSHAQFSFEWDTPHRGALVPLPTFTSFHTFVENNGSLPDVYHVSMVKTFPGAEWVGAMCVNGFCYDPSVVEVDVPVPNRETAALDIDITALDIAGEGWCDVTVASTNNPLLTETVRFKVVSSGVDVLLVDNDGGAGYEAYYQAALLMCGRTYGTWDAGYYGKPGQDGLTNFENVIWEAGNNLPGLDGFDRMDLAFYVQQGGHLFISGQDLAYASCDPASPYFDAAAPGWFASVLGASYLARNSGGIAVEGLDGDLITDGMSFAIQGGSGANNNYNPDRIAATGTGVPRLDYDVVSGAGVSATHGGGSSFYCAFGFESIADPAPRNELMSQVLAWFADELVPAGDDLPLLVRVPYAAPNPFNPLTAIRFEVGGQQARPVEVVVYDLKGQAVRHLFSGSVNPGPVSLNWNGRDNRDRVLATGVYLARVQVDQLVSTVKLTLAK